MLNETRVISELRDERHRLIATLDSLSDEEFDHGPTLCTEWSPRDVLGHVIGIDYFLASYWNVLAGNPKTFVDRMNAANGAQAERARKLTRAKLMAWAGTWADKPSMTTKLSAPLMLGDLGVHHQDVLRGLGVSREVPDKVAQAIYTEGLQLSAWSNQRVFKHRFVPTDGGRPVGRRSAPEVRGTREALGMWLAGRDIVTPELTFL